MKVKLRNTALASQPANSPAFTLGHLQHCRWNSCLVDAVALAIVIHNLLIISFSLPPLEDKIVNSRAAARLNLVKMVSSQSAYRGNRF